MELVPKKMVQFGVSAIVFLIVGGPYLNAVCMCAAICSSVGVEYRVLRGGLVRACTGGTGPGGNLDVSCGYFSLWTPHSECEHRCMLNRYNCKFKCNASTCGGNGKGVLLTD